MKQPFHCLISLLMVLSLLFGLCSGVFAAPSATQIITDATGYTIATDVVYNTVDGYLTNWGARGEGCLFLSTYAQNFYTGSYTYAYLSKLSGGTSSTNAPSSTLYSTLQTLMTDRHTYFTKYGSTSSNDCKYIYRYTDCMSNDPTYVSTLYRGLTVGGAWDSGVSYNQEHVWPQSKCIGSSSTDIGDIMHLRPANPSENSSRGNTAYGESSGYYDPGISVRGDCARTVLYMYVRWGNTANMWGTDGVMESVDILLQWMQEDPVDTWEMGRNDAVQSITGTRNVFVDYPELAWRLFGQSVPSDASTPSNPGTTSGGGSGSDSDSGSGSGSVVTYQATLVTDASQLKAGDQVIIAALDYDYALSTTQNTSNRGQASAVKSGNTLNYATDTQVLTLSAGTVSGTFALETDTQYLYAPSSTANNLKSADSLTDNGSWSISIDAATGAASIVASGSATRNVLRYNATSSLFSCYAASNNQKDICLYKLGSSDSGSGNTGSGGSSEFTLLTDASSLKAGDEIIITALDYDFALGTTQNTNNRGQAAITKSGNKLAYGSDTQIITLEAGTVSGSFGFLVGDNQYLYAASSSSNQLKTATSISDNGSWSITVDSATGSATIHACGSATRNQLRYNTSSSLFSCYSASNTQKDVAIYYRSNGGTTQSVEYYLFGYINGADYACESDYENMGIYKFVNGSLTTSFTEDSYVAVKTSNNAAWYMCQSYVTDTSATLHNTSTGAGEKMFVPGNTQITFHLSVNGNDTLTLSYATAKCVHSYKSEITTAATCTASGVRTYTCSNCADSYTESIAAYGHSYSSKVTAAGCESQGYTAYTCASCGHSYTDSYTAATGHSYTSKITTAATCTTSGVRTYTCSKCADSYTETIKVTGHSYSGKVTAPGCETQGYTTYTCSGCGNSYIGTYTNAVGHSYTSKVTSAATCTTSGVRTYTCSSCGSSYKESIPATGHQYSNGKCVTCGTVDPNCTHSYSSKVTVAATCTSAGIRTYTCTLCGDVYTEAISATGHKYASTVTSPTCTQNGYTTYRCTICGDSYTGNQTVATGHNYSGGSCQYCGAADPDSSGQTAYYLFGYVNGTDYACEADYENMGIYKFVDGKLTVTFSTDSYVGVKTEGNSKWFMTDGWMGTDKTSATLYDSSTLFTSDKFYVPGNVRVDFTLTVNADGSLTLSYTTDAQVCNHSYSSKITTAAGCTTNGVKTYTCSDCGATYTEVIVATGHSYTNGFCTSCGAKDPAVSGQTYYLFGYINGANYACEEDYENMGRYQFVNGKLRVTFTEDSYVGVKTEGNTKWFMTDGWQGTDKSYVTLYDTSTLFTSDKFYVPGNVPVTFSLIENVDGTLILSYSTTDNEPSAVPTLALKYPTVSFEDVIVMNVYYTAENLEDVVEMGLITYSSNVSEWNVYNADGVIPGYSYDNAKKMYVSSTKGIAGKNLGDTLYFAVYAKLTDGTYTYTKLVSYSPKTYAYSQLSTGSADIKPLVVAMLEYGAAAQTFFGHNTNALVNNDLTSAQRALIESYRSDMMASVVAPSTAKQGAFVATGGHVNRYPTISFEGAFSINYYYTPSYQPVDGITMFYWNQADYDAVNVLTAANATGAIKMAGSGTSRYEAAVEDIAAKDLDMGIYVAFIYSDGINSYASGVLSYSIGAYCTTSAAGTGAVAPLAAATAVYGYYAKQTFY